VPFRSTCIHNFQKHVWFGAFALGLATKEVLIPDSWKHVSLRALALGLPNREVPIRDS
jgi:hypothetical protein